MEDKYTRSAASLLVQPAGEAARVSLAGLPLHLAALTPGRCDLAPNAVRRALGRYSTYDESAGRDLVMFCADFGDLDIAGLKPEAAFPVIVDAVEEIARRTTSAMVLLGGDNSVTRPGVQAVARRHPRLGLITVDAHHDVRELDHGLTNGNPISALLSDGFPGSRIVQIGIQPFANSAHYAEFAGSRGIRFLTVDRMKELGGSHAMRWALDALQSDCEAIYIDFDIDVLDRVYAPSAAGSRPGGLSIDQAAAALETAGADPRVFAVDIVEHNPANDVGDITSLSAAFLLLKLLSRIQQRAS